jgi:hypothetical protein
VLNAAAESPGRDGSDAKEESRAAGGALAIFPAVLFFAGVCVGENLDAASAGLMVVLGREASPSCRGST